VADWQARLSKAIAEIDASGRAIEWQLTSGKRRSVYASSDNPINHPVWRRQR